MHTTLTWKHKLTHAVNVTIHFFFLHFRGTNHIAGSRLSIGKAGGYSKEQDKKKKKTTVKKLKKAQQNTVVGETARMTQDIQTSCHQEHISSDFQSQETLKNQ